MLACSLTCIPLSVRRIRQLPAYPAAMLACALHAPASVAPQADEMLPRQATGTHQSAEACADLRRSIRVVVPEQVG